MSDIARTIMRLDEKGQYTHYVRKRNIRSWKTATEGNHE